MKKIIYIILIFFNYSLFSQVSQIWVRSYGFSNYPNSYGNRIALDKFGNVYMACNITENGNDNIYTVKYNSNGDVVWYSMYNDIANRNDYATGITADESGNVYLIGVTGDELQGQDYLTIKYNSSGVQQWIQIYNGYSNTLDIPRSISIDQLGNVYITGSSPLSAFNDDYCTIKYSASGVQQWVQRYNGPGNSYDDPVSLRLDQSGYVYVTGTSIGATDDYEICTIKYNTNGVQQWLQRYHPGINISAEAYGMVMDANNNIYITGLTEGTGNLSDIITLKYNSSGVQQWVNIHDGPAHSYDEAYGMGIDSSNNIVVTGRSMTSVSNYDLCTIKYNSAGIQQWIHYYSGAGNDDDCGQAVSIDKWGNIYITGYSTGITSSRDYTTIKYTASGTQQWITIYNSGGDNDDISSSIVSDNGGNIYVNGRCGFTISSFQNLTIRYHSTPEDVMNLTSTIPEKYYLSQNYPNPFNPATKIKFDVASNVKSEMSDIKLIIYDILGREVATLVNEKLSPGTYEVAFDGSNFPSGVYFYKLVSDNVSAPLSITKRMVLVK